MEILKQNSGIDISKETFYASFMVLTKDLEVKHLSTRKFDNTEKGIERYYKWVERYRVADTPMDFTMEATGVYYENLAYFLLSKKEIVHVLLPNIVKNYFKSLNIKLKTDKTDAQILGQMGVERQLPRWQVSSEIYRLLKNLTREREHLVVQTTMVKNQLHAEKSKKKPLKSAIKRYEARLKFYKKQILEIEEEIESLVKEDESLREKIKKVTTIPGVSLLTAIVVIAETNGFANFTSIKQLSSYAGYDVQIKESGKYKGRAKISKKGNRHIRRALYMPSLSYVVHSKTAKYFYERIKQHSSRGLIAQTAVQRKLLALIYTLWKNDSVFIDNYQDITSGKVETMPSFC